MRAGRHRSRRGLYFSAIPDELWYDWRWQLSNRLNSAEEIGKVISLDERERRALTANHLFRVDITPYFVSLIDRNDPSDPIRRQVIPTMRETMPFTGMMWDSLAEDEHSPVHGLVHRYPDRVLMLVTTQCASYCRHCTRSRIVGKPRVQFTRQDYQAQLDYIRRTPQVRDVLLSGGDPLVLSPIILEELISELRAIEHVEVIRIGSRAPVFAPMRVDQTLCDMLQRYHPIWLNIHCNHPNEVTPELEAAMDRLTRAGVPVGCQTVLLAGVNDCVHLMRKLLHELVRIRVRPYYLYQCDLIQGGGHFRTPVAKGLEIMEGLIGHTSGYAVPTFVVDAPGGGGKIPLYPSYLLSQSDQRLVLRNYEGFITTYQQPDSYRPHDPASCKYCQDQRDEPGQTGLLGLLEGERSAIKPEGFDQTHARKRSAHLE